jgi:ADP-ribose pyrophosphatase
MTTPENNDAARRWRVLERRELLRRDPWLAVSVERVRLPDGRIVHDYHRLALQDIAVILAVDDDNRLLAFHGYRHGLGGDCLTLPGGAIDPGETPAAAAARELWEESGLTAAVWRPLRAAVTNANYRCNVEHYFLARDLRRAAEPDKNTLEGDLEEVTARWLSPNEVRAALDDVDNPLVLGVMCGFMLYLRLIGD